VARGELVLIAAAITAAAVGELFGAGTNRFEIPKLFAGGAAIVILILASLYFADVSAVHQAGQKPDLAVVRTVSSWLFLFAVASSGSCVALAEI